MMPWSSQKEEKKDEGQDLTTILDPEQRSGLTLLIASATESIRRRIEDAFDASVSGASDKPLKRVQSAAETENAPTKEDQEKERLLQEKREKELSAPRLQELKKSSLQFFEDWRDSVLQRVGETVNSRETAKEQKKKAQPTSSNPTEKQVAKGDVDEGIDEALHELYPAVPTPLAALPRDQRILILHSMLLLLLSLEHYIAHSRVLLLFITSSLKLPLKVLKEDETKIAQGLLEAAKHMSGEEETKKKAEENAISRKWKVGIASVAGAALIGVTGGLAAPLVAAGIGGVMGGLGLGATAAAGYLGTLASSGVIVGSLFGAYGGRMTGKMMDEYAREVEDFAFLPVRGRRRVYQSAKEAANADRRLRVAIGVSGWLAEKEEVVKPWRVVGKGAETFALRWELDALMKLGNAMTSMVKSAAWGYAKSEIIKRTIFASLTAALWPIGLLKISRFVDNPFSVAKNRGDKAGEILADALINRAQGERPVTLIGYSLGARVIYSCLMSLARRNAFGLIESVVLIGSPCPSASSDWRVMRSVVSGRLVNVFSQNDYILAFLYRTSSIQFGIAGLQPVEGVKGVENVDVSKMVDGHLRYRYLVGSVMRKIGFEDIVVEEVEKEEAVLELLEEQEEKEDNKNGEAEAEAIQGEADAEKLERDIKQKEKTSKMTRDTENMHIE